jgi:hypothetical protein
MILLIHIVAALSSLVYATVLFMRPYRRGFYVNYGLITLTLVSGTYLVITTHAQLMQACGSGLAYLLAVSFGMVLARRKLTAAEQKVTKS